jgi:hypothetical protein
MKALNCLIYQKTQNRIKRMIRKIEIHVIQMYNFFLIVALLRDQKFDEEDLHRHRSAALHRLSWLLHVVMAVFR